jgi:lipopolysaccharide/colanic/teichoic acid biosynthesis glycosyltransferase
MAQMRNAYFAEVRFQRYDARKRLFDIAAAAIGLGLCLPLLALIAVAIKCDSAGPILFRQIRVGRGGRTFQIMKFRTMHVTAEGRGSHITADGDPRITRCGAGLRALKFDELPQLFNVLAGDMSLVGPRPETPDLMAHYSPGQRADLLSIRPGVTDYASIALRNEGMLLARASDPDRFYRESLMPLKHQLCRRYLAEFGFRSDVKIIVATLAALFSRQPPRSLLEEAAAAAQNQDRRLQPTTFLAQSDMPGASRPTRFAAFNPSMAADAAVDKFKKRAARHRVGFSISQTDRTGAVGRRAPRM